MFADNTQDLTNVLSEYYEAINEAAWDKVLCLTSVSTREEVSRFITTNSTTHEGILNIESIRLVEAMELNIEKQQEHAAIFEGAWQIARHEGVDEVNVNDVKGYLSLLELKAYEEDEFVHNGYDYRVDILICEDDGWKIASSSYPTPNLINSVYFGQEMPDTAKRYIQRYNLKMDTGFIVNDAGSIISVLSDDYSMLRSLLKSDDEQSSSIWYDTYWHQACELIGSSSDSNRSPETLATLEQVLYSACRIHDAFFEVSENALNDISGHVSESGLTLPNTCDLSMHPTRSEVMMILYHMLPENLFPVINEAVQIRDIDSFTTEGQCVIAMYRAGIVCGYQDGLFNPNQPITQAELATVISRIAEPLNRVFVYR